MALHTSFQVPEVARSITGCLDQEAQPPVPLKDNCKVGEPNTDVETADSELLALFANLTLRAGPNEEQVENSGHFLDLTTSIRDSCIMGRDVPKSLESGTRSSDRKFETAERSFSKEIHRNQPPPDISRSEKMLREKDKSKLHMTRDGKENIPPAPL